MSIELQLDQANHICLVKIDGNFDVTLSGELLPVTRNIPTTVNDIFIDLGNTRSLDATAIANLVMFYSESGENREIRIVNCNKAVARVLTISGVSRLMTVCTNDVQPATCTETKVREQDRNANPVGA